MDASCSFTSPHHTTLHPASRTCCDTRRLALGRRPAGPVAARAGWSTGSLAGDVWVIGRACLQVVPDNLSHEEPFEETDSVRSCPHHALALRLPLSRAPTLVLAVVADRRLRGWVWGGRAEEVSCARRQEVWCVARELSLASFPADVQGTSCPSVALVESRLKPYIQPPMLECYLACSLQRLRRAGMQPM